MSKKKKKKIVSDGRDIPARTAVLSTMELIELTLHEVDMKTVFHAQRVSSTWRNIIQGSIILQRELFFAPTPRSTENAANPPVHNPMLKRYFGCFYIKLESFQNGVDPSCRGIVSEDVNYITTGRLMGMGMAGSAGARRVAGAWKPEAFLRAGASWRRMLVSQPPPRRVECVRVQDGRNRYTDLERQYHSVRVPRGSLTMGQLYDLVFAITFDRHENSWLSWVGWPGGPDSPQVSRWVGRRLPRDHEEIQHDWKSMDCIIIGEEGVGNSNSFCREHYAVSQTWDPNCDVCRQFGWPTWMAKVKKRQLRKQVSSVAPYFRCEEYDPKSVLVLDHHYAS